MPLMMFPYVSRRPPISDGFCSETPRQVAAPAAALAERAKGVQRDPLPSAVRGASVLT